MAENEAPEKLWLPDGFAPRTDGYWWAADHMATEKDIPYVRADRAAPTVESALAELREMFPYNEVAVVHKTGWLVSGLRPWISYHIRIGDPVIAEADSLARAMAQVRQWKEEQDG